jgi:hypothetical protein
MAQNLQGYDDTPQPNKFGDTGLPQNTAVAPGTQPLDSPELYHMNFENRDPSMRTGGNDMLDFYSRMYKGTGGDEAYKKMRQLQLGEQYRDPLQQYGRVGQLQQQDPRFGGTQRWYDQSFDRMGGNADWYQQNAQRFNRNAQGFLGGVMPELWQRTRQGGPSYVNQAAAAQRQQANQAIGQQAMMGSRGNVSAAAQRAAIMGASGTQANMAAQVAAARAQERQQALGQYMQARQAQMGMQQAGLGAMQQSFANRQAINQAQQQRHDMAAQQFGARMGAAQKSHEQMTSAFNQLPEGAPKARY